MDHLHLRCEVLSKLDIKYHNRMNYEYMIIIIHDNNNTLQ